MEKYGVVVLSNGVAQVGVLLPNSSSGGSMKQCLPSSPHVDLSCQEWMWWPFWGWVDLVTMLRDVDLVTRSWRSFCQHLTMTSNFPPSQRKINQQEWEETNSGVSCRACVASSSRREWHRCGMLMEVGLFKRVGLTYTWMLTYMAVALTYMALVMVGTRILSLRW